MAQAKKKKSVLDVVSLAAEQPLVLAGTPQQIGGEIQLQNTGAEKIVLRHARLRGELPLAAGRAGQPLAAGLGTLVLRPGQVRPMPLNLNLNPHTPPGEYKVELEVGDRTVPLELHVAESIDLSIAPNPVVVENRPGEKIRKRLLFQNLGNVPLTIGQVGGVLIEDEDRDCRASRAALRNREGEFESVDDYYVQLGREYTRIFEDTGLLRVLNTEDEVVIAPGELRAIEFEIRVPDKLDKHTRYHGRAAIYTADLFFAVVPAQRGFRQKPEPAAKKEKPAPVKKAAARGRRKKSS